jgi:hypothetical protein
MSHRDRVAGARRRGHRLAQRPDLPPRHLPLRAGRAGLVGFTSGTDVSPAQYAWVIQSLKTTPPALETRVLGTDRQLVTFSPTAASPHPFSTWLLGDSNHGTQNPSQATCGGCHGTLTTKPATYKDITPPATGFCFTWHNGPGGPDSGWIDPTQ